MTYQQHEILPDGAVLLAVTEDGRTATYVMRGRCWFGKNFERVTDDHKLVKLCQLFAEGRARQSVDRYLDL